MLQKAFHRARLAAPTTMIIDDIDAIFGMRSQVSNSVSAATLLSVLLNEMDGLCAAHGTFWLIFHMRIPAKQDCLTSWLVHIFCSCACQTELWHGVTGLLMDMLGMSFPIVSVPCVMTFKFFHCLVIMACTTGQFFTPGGLFATWQGFGNFSVTNHSVVDFVLGKWIVLRLQGEHNQANPPNNIIHCSIPCTANKF